MTDMLDNTQSGYCVDISGGKGAQADPSDGLQGHTCYSPGGSLGVDQIFDTAKFKDGLLYMTRFDVCAAVASMEPGSDVSLATCDGSDWQQFVFSGAGAISPAAATDMCFTLGQDTRSGRSDVNQIKALTLELCSDELAPYQTWAVRSSLN